MEECGAEWLSAAGGTGLSLHPCCLLPPPPPRSYKPALPTPAAATEQATSSSKRPHPGLTEEGLRKRTPTMLPSETHVSTRPTSRNLSLWPDLAEPPAGGDQLLLARGQDRKSTRLSSH